MKPRRLGWAVTVLALPAQAATLTESDFLAELPVVLTVSKMTQPLADSPAAVTVIDQDMIRASGYQDIPDLLRLVPGFSVAYTRDNTYAVGYHGFADAYSRRFQVLVDGRSIYSPHFGEVGWGMLPLALEDIERIEVVRGPNAAVYGANAFFAIINIISKDPSQTPGKLAALQAGEQNMAGGVFRYGGEHGDLRYRLTFSSQHRDRFERTVPDDPVPGVTRDYYERTYTRFFNGRWDYRLSNTDQVSAQIGLTGGNWNAGREGDPAEPRAYEPLSGFAQLRFSRVTGADEEWAVQMSHVSDTSGKRDFLVPLPPLGDVIVEPNIRQWRTQLDFSATRRLNPRLRLAWGGELRHEAVEGAGGYGTDDRQEGVLANLFAHAEWRPAPDWLVQGGALIGHHYFTGFEISPRLAVNHYLSPRDTLRFAVSRATRAPTFFEQKGDAAFYTTGGTLVDQYFVPSGGLKPEVNTSAEIGYLGQWPGLGAQLDVRIYRDHVTDYLGDRSRTIWRDLDGDGVSETRDKHFQHLNGGTLDVTGLDAQLGWKPHRDFSLHVAQSFAHVKASADIVDDDLPESAPDWITSLLASWRFAPGWNLSAMLYRTDRMMWLSDGDTTRAYTRADFRLARQFRLGGAEAEWALGVQNAGDDYEEFRRQNIFSRRGYATLRLAW